MKNKFLGLGAILLSTLSLTSVGLVAATSAIAAPASSVEGAEKQKIINAANRAINSLGKIEGQFTQRNPDLSISTGKFYLSRPGKMRFEYNAPSQLVMVSNGTNVGISDRRLKNLNQYPLKSTPLYFLLKSHVDIAKELNVTAVVKVGNSSVIYLRDNKKQTQGELRLVFDGNMQLTEWAVINQQNQMTYVKLQNVKTVSNIPAKLFVIDDPRNRVPRSGSGK